MDALEFYVAELEAVQATRPPDHLWSGMPDWKAYADRLDEAVRSVVTAWDAENTPPEAYDPHPGAGGLHQQIL
jgi:hypothetical protein